MLKTHCYNCNIETNQDVLFTEKEFTPREIVLLTDTGVGAHSVWDVVGYFWHVTRCRGCEKINFKHILKSSPDKENDIVFYFPKKAIRPIPYWVRSLPVKYVEILQEVYHAINEGLFSLSLTGIRTILDVYIVEKIGDVGTFKQKLQRLVENSFITNTKANVLATAIDAGNASAHRGYKPDEKTLFQILDIIENLLESEVVDRNIENIRVNIPKRKKPD